MNTFFKKLGDYSKKFDDYFKKIPINFEMFMIHEIENKVDFFQGKKT